MKEIELAAYVEQISAMGIQAGHRDLLAIVTDLNDDSMSKAEFAGYVLEALLLLSDTKIVVSKESLIHYMNVLLPIDQRAKFKAGIDMHWLIRALWIDKVDQTRLPPGPRRKDKNLIEVDFVGEDPIHW